MNSEATVSAGPTKQSTLESTEAIVELENSKDAGSTADAESTSTVDGVVEEAIVVTIPTSSTRANATAPVAVNKISVVSDIDVSEAKSITLLSRFFKELPLIVKLAEHDEMWGIVLADEFHIPSCIVLEKFLRANNKNIDKAKTHLIEALKWRKHMNPLKLLSEVEFSRAKFGNLGYVTEYERNDGKGKEIITWNIYGGVQDLKTTFGDIEAFIKWRCALMELSVKQLDLSSATTMISENGPDPYRMIQVHDYLSVSFLRMDPVVRAASKETIQVFGMAYPELLKEKFFVNVPMVMSWVFSAMKIFLSETTIKKFHPLSSGGNLARHLPSIANRLPTVYGGKGKDIREGLTVNYDTCGSGEASTAAKGDDQNKAAGKVDDSA